MTLRHDVPSLNPIEQEAAEWLARLRAGRRADQVAFEEWYSADPAHADTYDQVLASWKMTGGLSAPATAVSGKRRSWVSVVAAVAAVVLLCVGLVWVAGPMRPASAQTFELATRVGEVRTIALADGSRVTLDTQSAIRGEFGADRRHVRLLKGRAHFEVAGELRPFVIETETASVTTAGATLDVTNDRSQTDVGVVSGAAALKPVFQDAVVHIPGGRRVMFGKAGQVGEFAPFETSNTRWTTGMLSFENAPLASVIAAANRYSDKPIVLTDPSLGALKFTGTFKAADTADLARMIAAMFHLTVDASDRRRFALSRTGK